MHISHSSDALFSHCPRKWQLRKLLDAGDELAELDVDGIHSYLFLNQDQAPALPRLPQYATVHTNYGQTFGAAAAKLLLTEGDIEAAILLAFQLWNNAYAATPKTFPALLTSLIRLHELFDYSAYKPLHLPDGRPAAELGTRIWLDPDRTDYYVLFPDIIMVEVATGQPIILEVKTTKFAGPLLPAYANSNQAITYSLPLRFLFPEYDAASWTTLYVINQVTSVSNPKIALLPVEHTEEERLGALMGIMLRYETIQRMREVDYFPKTAGGNCIAWGNVCEFFGVCDYLAQTCKPLSYTQQNKLPAEREGTIVLDLDIADLIRHELALQAHRHP